MGWHRKKKRRGKTWIKYRILPTHNFHKLVIEAIIVWWVYLLVDKQLLTELCPNLLAAASLNIVTLKALFCHQHQQPVLVLATFNFF